jgi:hypothetical protein
MTPDAFCVAVMGKLQDQASIDMFLYQIYQSHPTVHHIIAAQYIQMHVVAELLSHRSGGTKADRCEETACSMCGTALDRINVCARCGISEAQPTAPGQRRTFDVLTQRRNHFKMAINFFQGKSNRQVPAHVIEYVTDRVGRIPGMVTRSHVAAILRSRSTTGFSKYYREISQIHHLVTNNPLPNLSEIETQLLLMFDIRFFFFIF